MHFTETRQDKTRQERRKPSLFDLVLICCFFIILIMIALGFIFICFASAFCLPSQFALLLPFPLPPFSFMPASAPKYASFSLTDQTWVGQVTFCLLSFSSIDCQIDICAVSIWGEEKRALSLSCLCTLRLFLSIDFHSMIDFHPPFLLYYRLLSLLPSGLFAFVVLRTRLPTFFIAQSVPRLHLLLLSSSFSSFPFMLL